MKAVNLIPSEQRGDASVGAGRSGGAVYALLGLVAVIAVMAFLYGKASHEISSEQGKAATINAEAQSAQAQANQLAPYASFVALREQRAQAVAALVDSRFDWAHVFHEFGRVLSAQTSISSLSGTIGSGTSTTSSSAAGSPAGSSSVTSATPPGSVPTFTLTGCATSQDAVAQMLQRLRLIDGVDEVTLQSAVKSGVSAGGGSAGACPGSDVAYSVGMTFDALPSASAAAAAAGAGASTVADQGAAASAKAGSAG